MTRAVALYIAVFAALSAVGVASYYANSANFGANATFNTIQKLCAAQEAYFDRTGTYYQVMRGGIKPERESKTVEEAFGGTIPPGVEIITYEREGVKGYQVIYDDGTTVRSCGSGPETAERISIYPYPTPPPPTNVASTTP